MSILASLNVASTEQPVINIEKDEEAVGELMTSLQSRLAGLDEREMRDLVNTALRELGPVRVTNFLPILVERRIRDLRSEKSAATTPRDG